MDAGNLAAAKFEVVCYWRVHADAGCLNGGLVPSKCGDRIAGREELSHFEIRIRVFRGNPGEETSGFLGGMTDAGPGKFDWRFELPTHVVCEARQNCGYVAAPKRGVNIF